MIYNFNNFLLDTVNFTLTKVGESIPVEPQVFNIILYLIEHKDRVVSRQELLDTIWKDKVVADSSISNHIKSARKILDDDGIKQAVIKTIHGRGYQFVAPFEGVTDIAKTAERSHKPAKIFSKIIATSVLLLLIFFAIKYYQQVELNQAVQKIAGYQEVSYATFIAQAKRRNELVVMIEDRIGEMREMQYEKYFSYYFKDLNNEEKFVFDQIRAMTDIGLYQNNLKILEELNNNPEIFNQIKGTKELQQHLIFWMNKYHSLFKTRPDMCLLYVGVEDGVPYPSHVNENIKNWLQNKRENVGEQPNSNEVELHPEVSITTPAEVSNDLKNKSNNSNLQLNDNSEKINQGLIAYYPFNGNANDDSGNNNHGTLSDVVLTTNRFGKNSAYEFNGRESVISVPNSPSIMSPKNEFSVVVWVNAYGMNKESWRSAPIIIKSDSRENKFQYQFFVSDNGMTIAISNRYNSATFPVNLTFNQWHMLTVTIKYGIAKGYYDGTYIGEKEIIGPIYMDTKPLKIGHDSSDILTVFNGKIDDLRLYNRALNAKEVEKLFNLPDTSL